jgi:hypothetical protein
MRQYVSWFVMNWLRQARRQSAKPWRQFSVIVNIDTGLWHRASAGACVVTLPWRMEIESRKCGEYNRRLHGSITSNHDQCHYIVIHWENWFFAFMCERGVWETRVRKTILFIIQRGKRKEKAYQAAWVLRFEQSAFPDCKTVLISLPLLRKAEFVKVWGVLM